MKTKNLFLALFSSSVAVIACSGLSEDGSIPQGSAPDIERFNVTGSRGLEYLGQGKVIDSEKSNGRFEVDWSLSPVSNQYNFVLSITEADIDLAYKNVFYSKRCGDECQQGIMTCNFTTEYKIGCGGSGYIDLSNYLTDIPQDVSIWLTVEAKNDTQGHVRHSNAMLVELR